MERTEPDHIAPAPFETDVRRGDVGHIVSILELLQKALGQRHIIPPVKTVLFKYTTKNEIILINFKIFFVFYLGFN